MARRYAGKTSSRSAITRVRGGHSKAKSAAAESALSERLAALERERDTLRAALEREASRVRQLEQMNAQVRDRLTWALDSLQGILEPKR